MAVNHVFMPLFSLGIKENAAKLKAFFLDLIFPMECLGCRREGVLLCISCFNKISFNQRQYCFHCKSGERFGRFCRNCRAFYSLNGILIAGDYEDELIVKTVKSLKYFFIRELSLNLGRFLFLFIRDFISKNYLIFDDMSKGEIKLRSSKEIHSPKIFRNFNNNLIVPVPLSRRRKRWRGFNQAELIAESFSSFLNMEIESGRLTRIKNTKPQVKLREEERKNNVKGCFAWQGENIEGRNIILIDDVATTGATLNECARVLKENGAGEVWGLVVAKG